MKDFGYKYLVITRFLRSAALIYAGIAMPLYLAALNVKVVYIGLVFLGVILFNMLISFISGILGDRLGYKLSLIMVDSIAFFGITLIALSSNIYLIIIGIILGGISGSGGAIRGTMSSGLTAFIANNWREDKERARKLAYLVILGSMGSVIGSAMLYFHAPLEISFGNAGAFKVLFVISSILLAVSTVLLLFVHDTTRPKKTTRVMKIESLRYTLRVIVSNMAAGMGFGIAIPLLPLWFALYYHASTTEISYIFTAYYAVTAVGSLIAGKIVKKFDLVNMGYITRVLNGVFLIAMALSPAAIFAGIFYQLFGLVSSLGFPSRAAVNIEGVHREDYGAASTIQGVAMRASQLTSGLSGYLLDLYLPGPLLVGGVLVSIGGVIYKKLMSDAYSKSKKNTAKH